MQIAMDWPTLFNPRIIQSMKTGRVSRSLALAIEDYPVVNRSMKRDRDPFEKIAPLEAVEAAMPAAPVIEAQNRPVDS